MQKQVEIFKILVMRSGMKGLDLAEKFGVERTYLSKLYRYEKLPSPIIEKACLVFGVDKSFFESPNAVMEPGVDYVADVSNLKQEIERLTEENTKLKAEVYDMLKKQNLINPKK